MNAIVGDRVFDEMPHVLFLRTPRDVGTIPHAKSPVVERHPGIGDRVRIDLIEPDDRETGMTLEGLARAVADGKPDSILPRYPHGEMPAHVIEISLLRPDRHDTANRDAAVVEHRQLARSENR